MIVNITNITDTDYTEEMPIGNGIEIESIQALVVATDAEIVAREGNTYTLHCEWGDGEGYDGYEVTIVAIQRDDAQAALEEAVNAVVTTEEAAQILGVNRDTVRVQIGRGLYSSARKSGTAWLLARAEVEARRDAASTREAPHDE